MPKFKVMINGCFYSLELYDAKGREVFDLDEAILAAEEEYGDDWTTVFNGEASINREDIETLAGEGDK